MPLQLAVAKTTAIGKQLVKLSFFIERNVVRPGASAEERTTTFTFGPMISNPCQRNPPKPVTKTARAELLTPLRDVQTD